MKIAKLRWGYWIFSISLLPTPYSLLLTAYCLLSILGCKGKEKESPILSKEIEQVIKSFELLETVEGIPNFRLKANKALLYENKTVVYKVTLQFYKKGTPYATLVSDSGVLFTPTNDMEAMGNVKVVGIEDAQLETHALKWINKINKIKTEEKVLITTKDNKKIKGKDFESDPGLTEIKLKETYGYGD